MCTSRLAVCFDVAVGIRIGLRAVGFVQRDLDVIDQVAVIVLEVRQIEQGFDEGNEVFRAVIL